MSRRISGFRQRWKRWRRGPWPKRVLASSFVLVTFGVGFYLAQLYSDISQLIGEREAALTSAIYSAPAQIRAGDDIDHLRLFDRLAQLSYSQTANPQGVATDVAPMLKIAERFGTWCRGHPIEEVASILRVQF